ncbi:hypothetical protein ACFQZU_22425, partial [Streptomonospora algeriensis]
MLTAWLDWHRSTVWQKRAGPTAGLAADSGGQNRLAPAVERVRRVRGAAAGRARALSARCPRC